MPTKLKTAVLVVLGVAALAVLTAAKNTQPSLLMGPLNGVPLTEGIISASTTVATTPIHGGHVVMAWCDTPCVMSPATASSGTVKYADGGSGVMTPLSGAPAAAGERLYFDTDSTNTHMAVILDGGTGTARVFLMQ